MHFWLILFRNFYLGFSPKIWVVMFRCMHVRFRRYIHLIQMRQSNRQNLLLHRHSVMLSCHPFLITELARYPEAIPNHSPSSRRDIRNSHPNKPSMHGEPNAEANTSMAASTCSDNPNPKSPAAYVAVGGFILRSR